MQKFWEVENCDFQYPPYSLDKQIVVNRFDASYSHDDEGKYIVPLPLKTERDLLGETRSMAM